MALDRQSISEKLDGLGYEPGDHMVAATYMQPSPLHGGGMIPVALHGVQIFSDDEDLVPADFSAFACIVTGEDDAENLSIQIINNRYLVEIVAYFSLDDEGSNDE